LFLKNIKNRRREEMNAKTVLTIVGIYLIVVGGAEYYSGTSQNSPWADTVAGLPSVGSAGIDLIAGAAIILFGSSAMAKLKLA
jgi:uncharacterized membrane protein